MSIERIDKQLQTYYESLQVPYDGLFAEYCDENGLDDESLAAEMEESAEDCILVDFDPDFPFPNPINEADRNNKILDLIKKCFQNKDLSFSASIEMPDFNEELFNVTDTEINDIKKIYSTQCPVLWNSGMEGDQSFLRILAIGRKHNVAYLQHLVDAYFRGRVENIESDNFSEVAWSQSNKHLKTLLNFAKAKNSKYTPHELALGSVKAFGSRCCPKLLFSNIIKINDSLEISVKYIVAAVNFISGLIKQSNSVCPFQVDLCLGFGAPSTQESVMDFHLSDDDDDDDDDIVDEKDEKNADFFDCIGDINAKLDKNKLTFELAQNDANDEQEVQSRTFGLIFNEFKSKCDKANKDYPQRRRFVTFVDRRAGGKRPKPKAKLKDDGKYDVGKDDIWMYEPPKNCRNIPHDVVPEWYINASRTCILPNMDYGDGKDAEATGKNNQETRQTKEKIQKANIGSSSHCKGSLLTLSFICKEQDAIKAYLYWNGQITRFTPEDIRDVFPRLFNMEFNGGEKIVNGAKSLNQQFIENTKEIDNLIKILNEKMHDKHFNSFQQSYD